MNVHGEVMITCEGRIIHSKLSGAFNSAGIQEYTNKIKSIIIGFGDAPFAILVDTLALEGGTPRAYQALEAYYQWLNSQPLAAKAMVTNSVINVEMVNAFAPSQKKQNMKKFIHHEEALVWLKSELNKVNKVNKVNKER